MKISVIIPVYNVKPYLERCLRSVLRQTYKDLEIIMVDDGSTDGSGELAESLKSLSPCIQVLHQENQGSSGARNTGMSVAQGEYLIFLDSDDEWLIDDGLEQLIGKSPDDCDLIAFKYVESWPSGKVLYGLDYDIEKLSAFPNPQEIFAYLVQIKRFFVSPVRVLVRRAFIMEHRIEFPLGYVSEDINWSLKLWQYVKTVSFHNLDFYCYHHREGTNSTALSIKMYRSYDKILSYWEQECNNPECINREPILNYMADLWTTLGYYYYKLRKGEKKEGLHILRAHKTILNHASSHKSYRSAVLVKLFGVKGTVVLLGIYWHFRTKIKREVV